jgi:hypothetical protein
VCRFKELARYTRTSGAYRKLLILRTSASEREAFKIHLVPYFESHEHECYGLFHWRHSVRSDKLGGLLGWLGERESEVDKVEVDYPDTCKENFGADWRLPGLAKKLMEVSVASPPEDTA